ncbi:MAG: hypothetical protein WBC90_08505 [Albidovulum sp.]
MIPALMTPCKADRSPDFVALAPGKDWGQETIIDSSYRLSYQPGTDGKIIATIAGQAFVTSETQLIFDAADA